MRRHVGGDGMPPFMSASDFDAWYAEWDGVRAPDGAGRGGAEAFLALVHRQSPV